MANRKAKQVLTEAVPFVGKDVVVIGPGPAGDGYFGTSVSLSTSQGIAHALMLVEEARKKLISWQRQRHRQERKNGTPQEPAGKAAGTA
jgi:hypothetical protein